MVKAEFSTLKLRGVALIVSNRYGEILILQEFEEKPHIGKYPGMFSIPMETALSGESDMHTLHRLAREELPGMTISSGYTLAGQYEVVPDVWVVLYIASVSQEGLPHLRGIKEEVGNHQWMKPARALRLWLRPGAGKMIRDYIKGRHESSARTGTNA